MISLILSVTARIFSNSYINVFQKLLTNNGEKSSIINFYTYLGLVLLSFLISPIPIYSSDYLIYILTMGLLGALGNFFIIKALSCGELSTLAPINSYKPIVALIFGAILLKEYPNLVELVGIGLIILGTFILANSKMLYNKSTLFRFLALIFSGTEAIFIKKVILLTNISSAFFYWALAGLAFSILFVLLSKHPLKINKTNFKYQIALIILVALMQYSTNYVFAKMNVAYALALFQLSTIVSVFLGVNIFKEKSLLKKLIASFIMLIGATIIILS